MHTIIITLMALLGLGLVGHGNLGTTSGSATSPAPHARGAMDIQQSGGPS